MELWIGITFASAFLQNLRSTLQKHLKGMMGTTGATFVRFVFGVPFALAYLGFLYGVLGRPLPVPNISFAIWAMVGAMAQIAATFLLVHLFSFRNFAVGTAYSRTEPAQAALFALIFVGESVNGGTLAAIAVSVAGDPLFQLTEAKKEIAVNDVNRQLFLSYQPPTDIAAQLNLLGTYSSQQKLLSSYLYPLLRHQRMDSANKSSRLVPRPNSPVGVSYPTWFVTPTASKDGAGGEGGTLQGRITCKNFRHQTDPDEIKALYRSRWTNGHIVGYDLSQIEMVVAGLLSGDDALCSAFCAEPPLDLHTSRATQVFGPDIVKDPDFKKVYRQAAKGANFGDLFRAGAPTLQTQVFKMTGVVVPMSICENIVKTRAASRPGLWSWQETLIKETRARGYVALPFIGQSRRFMGGDAYDVSEIVNMPIQCTAGNVLLRIQHHLHRSLPSINAASPDILMFLNVYDAIYFDCRSDAAVERLDVLFRSAFEYVTTEGYWARLCERMGRRIPVRYERTVYT